MRLAPGDVVLPSRHIWLDRLRLPLCYLLALDSDPLRLARVLAGLMPAQPEVLGLQALLEIQASRSAARTDAQGRPVLLEQQDRARWDRLLIHRGLAGLKRIDALGTEPGAYAMQARLAAHHARAATWEATDWRGIAADYDTLARAAPSPIVELNRAVAHGMAFGPEAGLRLLDALADSPALKTYAPLPAARGDCLLRAGRVLEAKDQFIRAAELATNGRERDFLLGRARDCA